MISSLKNRLNLRLLPRICALLLCSSLCAVSARAQFEPVVPSSLPQIANQPDQVTQDNLATASAFIGMTPEKFAAINLARLGVIDLRLTSSIQPEDHAISAYLLGLSLDLIPDNDSVLRRRLWSAKNAGLTDLETTLLREIIRLDPNDDVAQLELIRANVRSKQTADQRLATYRQLLDSNAAISGLSPEIRSRLALEAALMHRDTGDLENFADRLKLALQLDSTHLEAALVANAYYTSQIDNPIAKLELLINLVLADPLNPSLRFQISHLLGSSGSFSAAIDAINKGSNLSQAFGLQANPDVLVMGEVLEWQTNGAASLVLLANNRLASIRQQQLIALQQEGRTIDAKFLTLSAEEEVLRAVSAKVANDGATIDDALGSLNAIVELAQLGLDSGLAGKPVPPDNQPATPEQIEQFRFRLVKAQLDLHFVRLLVNAETDIAQTMHADLANSAASFEPLADYVRICTALTHLRTNQPQSTIDLLMPIRDQLPYAKLISAMAMAQLGDDTNTQLRNELLVQTAAGYPMQAAGAWARSILNAENPELNALQLTPLAAPMDTLYRSMPRWVDVVVRDPGRFLRLTVQPTTVNPNPLEPVELRLTLQNVSDVPLGVGPAAVVNSGVSLIAESKIGMELSAAAFAPEPFSLDRKFQLKPRESITMTIWPEIGWAGWVIDTGASKTTRTRWRALTAPRNDAKGNLIETAMSLSTHTQIIRRPALDTALLGFDTLIERLRTGSTDSIPGVLAAIRSNISGPPNGLPVTAEHMRSLVDVLLETYPTMAWHNKCSVLLAIPAGRINTMSADIRRFDDYVRTNETDPRVLGVVVVTRANFEDDQSISRALASDDPDLRRIAAAHKARLTQGRGGLAVSRDTIQR